MQRLADGTPRHRVVILAVAGAAAHGQRLMLRPSAVARRHNVAILALVGAAALALLGADLGDYSVHLANVALVMIINALALNLLFGHTGQVSLGQSAFYAVGAYGSAFAEAHWGFSFWAAVPLAAAAAYVLALVVGFPILRLKEHFLAIATLGLAIIGFTVANEWISVTGGQAGLGGFTRPVIFGHATERAFFFLIALVALLMSVGFVLLVRVRMGLALATIREDEQAARAIGVPVHWYKVQIFATAAAMTAIAGAFAAHLILFISPSGFDATLSIAILAAVVIGGLGTVAGAVAGGALVALLPALLFSTARYATLSYGALMGLIVLFLPGGLASLGPIALSAFRRLARWRPVASSMSRLQRVTFDSPAVQELPLPRVVLTERGSDPVLVVSGLRRSFGGVVAVKDISFEVERGEIFGVIGPNGAGKTTLFNMLTGFLRPQVGSAVFEGVRVTGRRPETLVRMGMVRTFQVARPFPRLTVLENVLAGAHIHRRVSLVEEMLDLPRARKAIRRDLAAAHALLDEFGLLPFAHQSAGSLSYGHIRLLEIARALASSPKILLLDEPAAGLNEHESEELVERLRVLQENGLTMLLVEHDMSLVMTLCDRILVMDAGEPVAIGKPSDVQSDSRVVDAYLGVEAAW